MLETDPVPDEPVARLDPDDLEIDRELAADGPAGIPAAEAGATAAAVTKARRPSRFDRPKPPHDWRWVVGGIGRVLISTGILMFGFVAYQLWGTALQTAAAQNRLQDELEDQAATMSTLPSIEDYLATLPDVTSDTGPASSDPASTDPSSTDPSSPAGSTPATDSTIETGVGSTVPAPAPPTPEAPVPTIAPGVPAPASPLPTPEPSKPIAQLKIPSIGVDWTVVEGVSVRSLRDGPAHFAETPLPGQFGNSAIAGHRTTYGQPFWSINEIQPGDEIIVDVPGAGTYYYVVQNPGIKVIDPGDYAAAVPTYDPTKGTLTLVSCEPRFSTSKRIIVIADLDLTRGSIATLPSAPGVAERSGELPTEEVPATTPVTDAPTTVAPVTPDTTAVDTTAAASAPAGLRSSGGRTSFVFPRIASVPTTPDGDGTDPVAETSEDAFSAGWFSDDGAWPHVAGWGLMLTLVSLGAYWVSRRTRRNWIGALVGFVPFVVVLYFFYENVNRLLPPAL